jgi:hypothetical protein
MPNRATADRLAEIEASGMLPVNFMLQVMRDETRLVELRLEATGRAAARERPRW